MTERGDMRQRLYAYSKRTLDLGGSSVGLVATAPLLALSAIGIRATMGRPVLFRQERPGLGGKTFVMFKFRTMKTLVASESDADRLTRLGRFLRASSVDELPTLVNVLKGDMSLVGPRPLLVKYLERYTHRQARRHEVKPGITGWAQINGRNSNTWAEKFELDLWYVENRSFSLDLKILFRTLGAVLKREGIQHEGSDTMPEFLGGEAQRA